MLFVPLLVLVVVGLLFVFECRSWAQQIASEQPASCLTDEDPNEPQPEMGLIGLQIGDDPNEPEPEIGLIQCRIGDDPNEPEPEIGLIQCPTGDEPEDPNDEPEAH